MNSGLRKLQYCVSQEIDSKKLQKFKKLKVKQDDPLKQKERQKLIRAEEERLRRPGWQEEAMTRPRPRRASLAWARSSSRLGMEEQGVMVIMRWLPGLTFQASPARVGTPRCRGLVRPAGVL
ncbi:unnamed protein product [Prorocentrum cordatum]|uniref:Uncharacterized protein n=1 Tax=Prorocentrum cordatum TaxID=2364126 RepID=A0ABN9Q1G4_9DINO|nr:unnamed protein product [Polarella glacialis]